MAKIAKIMRIHDIDFEPYISSDRIEEAISVLAERINVDYADRDSPLVVLITLSGAMIFASELCKRLTVPVELGFVKCSSYGVTTHSQGDVKFDVEPTIALKGRDVLVAEDIVDTGNTWVALSRYIKKHNARSVGIATLLLKEEVYDKSLPLDYVALKVENIFLVGYGLDYNQLGRNINAIYKASTR